MRFVTTRSTTGFHRVEFASQAALDAWENEGGSYHAVMVVGGFSTLAIAGRFDGIRYHFLVQASELRKSA
jgi:hypothetical protein